MNSKTTTTGWTSRDVLFILPILNVEPGGFLDVKALTKKYFEVLFKTLRSNLQLLNFARSVNTKRLNLAFTPLLFAALFQSVHAQTLNYTPPLNKADWLVESSVLECRLIQSIPDLGEAHFQHRAGESLNFQLYDFSEQLNKTTVALRSVGATWNTQAVEKDLGFVNLTYRLDSNLSLRLMTELLAAMMPTFQGAALHSPSQAVEVALSPVNFKSAFDAYQRCSIALLPVNFDQVCTTTLYWGVEVRELNNEAMAALDNVATYAIADSAITRLQIDSYTDTSGSTNHNQKISEERATNVVNYLVSKGVDAETITSKAHGEQKEFLIYDPESTDEERDLNRRLVIVMIQD